MRKIDTISSCGDCPYSKKKGIWNLEWRCTKIDSKITRYVEAWALPAWCPLPDYVSLPLPKSIEYMIVKAIRSQKPEDGHKSYYQLVNQIEGWATTNGYIRLRDSARRIIQRIEDEVIVEV